MSEPRYETDVDLTIYADEFEKQKKEARELGKERYSSEDDPNNFYEFENLWLDWSEEVIEGNVIKVSGCIKTQNDKEIGFLNIKVPLDFDKLIEIFQSYIKKLQKVKNVMESVKDE